MRILCHNTKDIACFTTKFLEIRCGSNRLPPGKFARQLNVRFMVDLKKYSFEDERIKCCDNNYC